jgi:hypothetical protein
MREENQVKVLCAGSRTWCDRVTIRHHLAKLPPKTIIVHGGTGKWDTRGLLLAGADAMCGEVAMKLGFEVRVYHPNWNLYGPAGGSIRNAELLSKEHPDKDGVPVHFVIVFAKMLSKVSTPDAWDLIGRAEKEKIEVSRIGE